MRKFHPKYGHGRVIELLTTHSGEPAALIAFDCEPQNERTILLKFLSDSSTPISPSAGVSSKKKVVPKRVSDALLVPESGNETTTEDVDELEGDSGGSLSALNTKYCVHGYIVPTDIIEFSKSHSARDLLASGSAKVSPYCLDCWTNPQTAELFVKRHYEKPTHPDPCTYGYCDLISTVVGKRGFVRDLHSRESKKLDLRARLLEKKKEIEKATAGKTNPFVRNYIYRALKNQLTNEQTSSEGQVIANSVKSLTADDGVGTDREALANKDAGDFLTRLTGGSSEDDDRSLDDKDELVQASPDDEPPAPRPSRRSQKNEARHLFDSLLAEASSQIATLTGGRKDGFETHLDLEKALSKIPNNERQVFEALYLENGELLNRPRTYPEAEFMTGLSTQNVRTLERKAVEKLRPALAPSFYKRRA